MLKEIKEYYNGGKRLKEHCFIDENGRKQGIYKSFHYYGAINECGFVKNNFFVGVFKKHLNTGREYFITANETTIHGAHLFIEHKNPYT